MASSSQPLLEQITQSPLLISASAEGLFQASVTHVLAHAHAAEMISGAISAANDDDFWPTDSNDWRAVYRPYNVKDGVLQIPVMGVLLNRFPYQLGRWATGYAYIEKAFQRGMADGNVKAIAFVIDSPGGEVAGCFELVDKISGARGEKPFRAFAADHSYSAAYAIASASDQIVVTRSGGVGSIGVVTAHIEYSEALKEMGIKVTFIFAGAHKVDGNAYEKLPESVKSRIQNRIDKIYGVFTSTVASNRGLDEKAVKATEALTYDANDAIEVGLADKVGALEDEMAIFSQDVSEAEEEQMAENSKPNDKTGIDQATHDAAVASAKSEGMKEGAVAAKTRITAILGSDEGKKKPKAAFSCAMRTDMTLEQAVAFLADMPEEKAEAAPANPAATTGKTPFDAAMSKDNPEVGAGSEGDKTQGSDADVSASILGAYAGATGRKAKAAA